MEKRWVSSSVWALALFLRAISAMVSWRNLASSSLAASPFFCFSSCREKRQLFFYGPFQKELFHENPGIRNECFSFSQHSKVAWIVWKILIFFSIDSLKQIMTSRKCVRSYWTTNFHFTFRFTMYSTSIRYIAAHPPSPHHPPPPCKESLRLGTSEAVQGTRTFLRLSQPWSKRGRSELTAWANQIHRSATFTTKLKK